MMNLAIAIVVALSLMAQPALAARGGSGSTSGSQKVKAEGQKVKGTNFEPARTCNKYFAIIGAVVSIPC
jgi:hypothetical protein